MEASQLIREIRKGTLKWYPFKEGSETLFVGEKDDPLFEMLIKDIEGIDAGQVVQVRVNELDKMDCDKFFDYIIAVESLETVSDVASAIAQLSKHLKEDGHMILGFNNRLGVRYFCGDHDPYTRQSFDGIENYRRAYCSNEDMFYGKCYDKATILDIIERANLNHQNYSVFSDFSNTQLLLRDDYVSNEDLSVRVLPTYNNAKTVFLEEEYLYNSLQNNEVIHTMANCLLFDCTFSGDQLDILQVTSSMGRDEKEAFFTIIHEGDENKRKRTVAKMPAYSIGKERLIEMLSIARELRLQGVDVIDMELDDNGNLRMPYIAAPTAQRYLSKLALEDEDRFLEELDAFVGLIKNSSDVVKEDEDDGLVLAKGYPDMVPLNCFNINGKYVFFDQEYYEESFPANAVIYRVIASLSQVVLVADLSVTFNDLLHRYGLDINREKWEVMEWEFLARVRKERELATYFRKKRHDYNQVYTNRQRINFSSDEYLRRFVNIFQGIENKKIILFGTGKFAVQFMSKYGSDYTIDAVIDNNVSKQGEEFYGVMISGVNILREYDDKSYRVIICIKSFLSVVRQLEEMGVSDYGVFDPAQVYIRPRKTGIIQSIGCEEGSDNNPKKYHTGYIAGVFDLFHVGHLEKFKLAKEQCDYLIVGLVSDEGVIKHKKTTPFVPYEDRKAMLEACRYVDEVVKIPLDYHGTTDAWKMYGFDVQFSGSDYLDNPSWLAEKDFLEQHGVDMVFFPYTESTSSSKLKALIDEKLI